MARGGHQEILATIDRMRKVDKARAESMPEEDGRSADPGIPETLPENQGPGGEVIPFPGVRKKPRKKRKRRRRLSPDIPRHCQREGLRGGRLVCLEVMHRDSDFMDFQGLKHYTGKRKGKGRFYLKGNHHLETVTGFSHATVERHLAWLDDEDLIRLRHRGYPGEGYSIWETPYNLSHVMAWRRKPRRKPRKGRKPSR